MKLSDILAITRDSHAQLPSGAVTVNLQADEADYWHLSDYAVSSRAGMMLVLVPRRSPVCDCGKEGFWQGERTGQRVFACASCFAALGHQDNGWQHHFARA